jgi:hypothetical protein
MAGFCEISRRSQLRFCELRGGIAKSLQPYTEGIPTRIDRALRELEVVPLSDLLSNNSDLAVHNTTLADASPSLRLAIRELANSDDPVLQRSYSLLKALSVFPQGEQLSRIKRFNSTAPFFPRHATELLDQGLIDVTSVQGLELGDSSATAKTLIVPKPIRELVRESMSEEDKEDLNRKAADMYFGPDWSRGTMKPPPAYRFDVPTRCAGDIANASTISPQNTAATENCPMAKKLKPIPTVPFELIIKGHEGVTAYRERHGQADLTVALVTTLADGHKPDEIIAVSYRLGALAKLIREGEVAKWTIPVLNQEYQLVNESMFRAAARAPLFEARTVGDVSFDPETFMKIALAESEAEGSA